MIGCGAKERWEWALAQRLLYIWCPSGKGGNEKRKGGTDDVVSERRMGLRHSRRSCDCRDGFVVTAESSTERDGRTMNEQWALVNGTLDRIRSGDVPRAQCDSAVYLNNVGLALDELPDRMSAKSIKALAEIIYSAYQAGRAAR